jgi:HD-GYP domain-containing protein (c-di-GMP phosphodiesterase class II)/class 3 adenylate cyclase
MAKLKEYIFRNFEQAFVLAVLVGVAITNYYIPYKVAFLDCYFIPILLTAIYLDQRRAVLGAVLCSILVGIYFALDPVSFSCGSSTLDLALNLTIWSGFLILTGAIVGRLKQALRAQSTQAVNLQDQLTEHRSRLQELLQEVQNQNETVESKVTQRTVMLEASRRTLETVKNKVEETLFATMDPEVAKLIIEERLRTEKREISVMFCDLEGFTSYSEDRQPELVIGELNSFLAEMEAVVMAYRGHIDKYTGDGLMAEFGAPVNYERHALLSVLAGLKMQEKLSRMELPWKMRLGIATGDPIVGLLGRKRQNYTAIGDTVNLASRIEEASLPGTVTVDEDTFKSVEGFVEAGMKTLLPCGEFVAPEDMKALIDTLGALQQNPDDLDSLRNAGFLFLKSKDPVGAHEYLKRALALDPHDQRAKLAFADTSIEIERIGDIAIRGRKRFLHLHEIRGLKDPLRDENRIPAALYREYHARVRDAVDYPEDLMLPVEGLDASIGMSKVVGFLSYVIADVLGLPDQDKKDILLAGYLADIGKSVLPHHLLNRAGSLDKEEFAEIKKHSSEGVTVLKKMGYRTQSIFDIIAAHHEHFNGSGYPKGLAGETIPLGSRIVAVADEYVAYVSWRPYRDRWDQKAAFAHIVKETQKGKFDPGVSAAFHEALKRVSAPASVDGAR